MREGKIIQYADPPLAHVEDQICWLCGGEVAGNQGMPTKKAIKPTFTDHPYARCQASVSICAGCAFCLSARELRNYSILATSTRLQHPFRSQWRDILIHPPEPPFVMCLAVSGQKHLSFKAPVNLDQRRFTVMLEERAVHVIPTKLKYCIEAVEDLYVWFSKDEIATGRYSQHKIKECSLRRWEDLEIVVAGWREMPLFDLALFVAQKREKPEEEKAVAPIPILQEVEKPHEPPSAIDAGRKRKDKESAGQLTLDWL